MSKIRYERDLKEAEMEEEKRALASVNVYKELEDQCRDRQYKESLAALIPEEPLHPTKHQQQQQQQQQQQLFICTLYIQLDLQYNNKK